MTTKHVVFLDYLRMMACVMVIVIHVSAAYVVETGGLYWDVGNFFDGYARVSVPLFFMISGYFFFNDKKPKTKNFLKIICTLLFYSLFSLVVAELIQSWFKIYVSKNWLKAPVYYHLWYLYRILLIYVCAILINSRKLSSNHLLVMFIVFFVVCNPAINDISKMLGINTKHYLQIDGDFFYFLLYAIFGGILARWKVAEKYGKWMQWGGIVCFGVSGGMVVLLTHFTQPERPFYSYISPLVAVAAMGLFIGFQVAEPNLKTRNWVSIVSKNSLAIYGVHAPLLSIAFMGLQYQRWNPLYTIPLMVFSVLFSSLAVAMVIKRLDKYGWVS